jgi:hypothetical protein
MIRSRDRHAEMGRNGGGAVTEETSGHTAVAVAPPAEHRRTKKAVVLDVAIQIGLLAALLVLYRLGRTIADGNVGDATRNAADLHSWEQALRLPNELSVERWFAARPDLAKAASVYYATVHFPLTALALLWLYVRDRSNYTWMRTVIVSMTALALLFTFTVPLAPPRLMPDLGFTDLAREFDLSVYGGADSGHANQYAAMPSLHVGWALLVAVALIRSGRSRWRFLWLLHPVLTLLVVVGTANHYWLDAGAAVALFGLCVTIYALLPDDVGVRLLRWGRVWSRWMIAGAAMSAGARALAAPASTARTRRVVRQVDGRHEQIEFPDADALPAAAPRAPRRAASER